MPKHTVDQVEETRHVFNISMTVSRQIGSPQQNSLDTLVHFSARLTPAVGAQLLQDIVSVINRYREGVRMPISESGARALSGFGREDLAAPPLATRAPGSDAAPHEETALRQVR